MRVKVGPIDQLPDGRGVRVEFDGTRVALFRVASEVYAIGDRCSHAEASLAEGELIDKEVECPRHGAIFDVTTGEPQCLPATTSVPTYRVEIEGSDVFLEVADT